MTTGLLILFVSIVLIVLDAKLLMENEKTPGFLLVIGGLLIFVLFWGGIFLNFAYNILPVLMYIPASYACGGAIGTLIVIISILRFFSPGNSAFPK